MGRSHLSGNFARADGIKMARELPRLSPLLVSDAVRAALQEDLGRAGDITSAATIPETALAKARIVARKSGVLAGLPLAACAFAELDPRAGFATKLADGEVLQPGSVVAEVAGNARAILSAERVALNFLCHLSGIATATADLVARVAHTRAHICDTRKTLPGLRALQKYAVRCGGGINHRFGLDDAILIKDNHIAVVGGVAEAVRRARAGAGHLVKIEVEVDTLEQLSEAMTAAPDVVLLDNMPPAQLRAAVQLIGGRAVSEASGGITPDTIAAVAEAGVDMISSGGLTLSASALDLGLDFEVTDGA
jgi:nicotinate-nucleotide pyrophosphorylase (carboxylating)